MPRSCLVVLVVGIASAAAVEADTLQATRNQPLRETAHTVDIYLDQGVATYTVRRTFENPGTVAEQVELEIGLPYGAAATGLRIRAGDVWHLGELLERDRAAALYEEMTGFGAHAPKDPALLAWMWADKLSLQVFPVMPGTRSMVEYTLTVPTRYQNGRYVISYPRVVAAAAPDDADERPELPLAEPVITVRPSWGHAHTPIFVDTVRITRDTPTVLHAPPRQPWEDTIERAPTASYVASVLTVPSTRRTARAFAQAIVKLDLRHTYRSDVRVELITPAGQRVAIHDRTGSGDNDLRGAYAVALPASTIGAGAWRLVVSDHAALDTGSLERWSLTLGAGADATTVAAADTPVFVPDAPESASEAGVATIAIEAPPIAIWTARLGRAVASAQHAFARIEVDVARELVPVPRRAQVVFVIDSSYSIGIDALATQLDLVRAYLRHVPDAEVELVTYRRRATRVFGRFVRATTIDASLAAARRRGVFDLGNGSALDDGARLATTLLADRGGPRRLVLVTDELTRSSLGELEALASLAALAPETIVHVVVPRLGSREAPVELERRDDAPLAPLATRHHGIFVELTGLVPGALKALVPVALELVRPTRIEKVQIPGFELDDDVLPEGHSVRLMIDTPSAPPEVTLSGVLWSDPITRQVKVDGRFSRATAAFVFGEDAHHDLSESEQMTIAMFGRAVSPVTSYLAAEPGVRPSTIGLRLDGSGFGRGGMVGHGGGTGSGTTRQQPDLAALIDTQRCVRRIRPAGAWTVRLRVETTRDEVVDVRSAAPSAMANCLEEATWALRLRPAIFDRDREEFDVVLAGPGAP